MLLTSLHNIINNRKAYAFLLFLLSSFSLLAQKNTAIERKVILMGSVFQITIVAEDSLVAAARIDEVIAEIDRIENLISEWRPETQISEVNRNAGIHPVKVDSEVFELTKRSIQYSEMSNGAFDISTAAMDRIWKFDGSMDDLPSAEDIKNSIKNVNYKNIILDSANSTIFLNQKGMKIGFGSIGKGYAADRGREIMQAKGVIAGMVDASGDIASWGKQPTNKPWLVGIRNPFKRHGIAKILKLKESSVATSGSYEKYVEIDQKRYSHIINPKTGMPSTGLTSVTIYGPSTEFANALSTSIMVLGEKEGKKLVKKHKDYKFIFITDKGKIIKR